MTYAPMTVRWVAVACFLLVAANFIALWNDTPLANLPARLYAQEPKAAPAAREPKMIGGQTCTGCHYKPTPLYEEEGVTRFVLLTESQVWREHDKHAKAFEWIDPAHNELSRQMCEKLKIPDIREARECLSCHANWQSTSDGKDWHAKPTKLEYGVSCEACHGAASEWVIEHTHADWRKLAPSDKLDKGFVDVRNPVARTRQCVACHVGDASQQKFVTHDMYAAGHPPLPSIELETFAAAMPAHWRTVTEKLAANKAKDPAEPPEFKFHKEFVEANSVIKDGGEFPASRATLLSAVVTMQSSLALVAAQAEQDKKLPDFAIYDCYACHHDLKSPAKAPRKEVGVPGRPHPAVWPTTLVRGTMAFANVSPAPFEKALAEYQAAFDAQPFGKPELIRAARANLQKELSAILAAAEKSPTDRAAITRAWDTLVAPTDTATLDYDAARQTAWAMQVLAKEFKRELPKEFAASLLLTLPPGQQKLGEIKLLQQRQAAMSLFEEAGFREQLKALREGK